MKHTHNVLEYCTACPRHCGVNRLHGQFGFCQAPALPKVALVSTHHWEEPPISGTNGSGTIFFSHCNLQCVFCQNHDISCNRFGKEISVSRLAEIFLEQQQKNMHNINLVSPTQFIAQIAEALRIAKKRGLLLPVVYNSNGYESREGLSLLDGLIDIYLPDFKYWDHILAMKYSHALNYREYAAKAILEMKRQTGKNQFDDNGILQKGMIVRHLILPNHYKDSFFVLEWIRENLGTDTCVSLLRQYTPMHKAKEHKELYRKLTTFEYKKETDYFFNIGLNYGFEQMKDSATSAYTPIFNLHGVANNPSS